MDPSPERSGARRRTGEGYGPRSPQLPFGGGLPRPRRAVLRSAPRKMERSRASAHRCRGALATLVALAAARSGPRDRVCHLRGGRVPARDRGGGPSAHNDPPVLRLVLRQVQRPGAGREDPARSLAAADRVRGAGAPESGYAGGDLAFETSTGLGLPLPQLPPPGGAHDALFAVEGGRRA